MPIFEKNGRRILFVHIPKTAGISVYLAFAEAGYEIKNLKDNKNKSSATSLLKDRYGYKEIECPDKDRVYPHPLSLAFLVELAVRAEKYRGNGINERPNLYPIQHAPRAAWKRWGRFDEIFTIVRNPVSRIESAMKYWHRQSGSALSLNEFCRQQTSAARSRPWGHWRTLGGHLIPQTAFVSSDTQVYRFEDNWKDGICARFDLDAGKFPTENVSVESRFEIDTETKVWIRTKYQQDFKSFGYDED